MRPEAQRELLTWLAIAAVVAALEFSAWHLVGRHAETPSRKPAAAPLFVQSAPTQSPTQSAIEPDRAPRPVPPPARPPTAGGESTPPQ